MLLSLLFAIFFFFFFFFVYIKQGSKIGGEREGKPFLKVLSIGKKYEVSKYMHREELNDKYAMIVTGIKM